MIVLLPHTSGAPVVQGASVGFLARIGFSDFTITGTPLECYLATETVRVPTFAPEVAWRPAHRAETVAVPSFPSETVRC